MPPPLSSRRSPVPGIDNDGEIMFLLEFAMAPQGQGGSLSRQAVEGHGGRKLRT